MLEIKNLHAEVEGTEILKGVDLKINPGEVHAIMGPNGSGKSTLANVVMGNPVYEVTEGSVIFEGEDITEEPVDNRAKLGMFLAFQYPESIPGVTIVNMLKTALTNIEETEYTTLELRLKVVGEGVSKLKTNDKGYLVVTHYQRLLEYIKPDFVHVFVDGSIVESGGVELSEKLEKEGYESYL